MLYATNIFPGDNTTTQFELTFVGGYLDRDHVVAYYEDNLSKVQTPIDMGTVTWLGPYTIRLSAPAPIGQNVVVARQTPREPLVDFQGSSRITEANLDLAHRQGLFVAVESLDSSNSEVVNQLKDVIIGVQEVADAALLSAAAAEGSATSAAGAAGIAAGQASQAMSSATAAQGQANAASGFAADALLHRNAAEGFKNDAAGSVAAVAASAASALASRDTAAGHASAALGSANTAAGRAAAALASQNAAALSAASASSSASTATTQASNANTSAGNAAYEVTLATAQKTQATTQAGIATTKATAAAASATAAANSQTAAATSASNAATSASNASVAATVAATASSLAVVGWAGPMQCRVVVVNAATRTLRLERCGGSLITINGVPRTIPAEGVTITMNPSSTPTHIWAGWNGTTVILIENSTVPYYDPTLAQWVYPGNSAYIPVAYARADGLATPSRFLRNYYNGHGQYIHRQTLPADYIGAWDGVDRSIMNMPFLLMPGDTVQVVGGANVMSNPNDRVGDLTINLDGIYVLGRARNTHAGGTFVWCSYTAIGHFQRGPTDAAQQVIFYMRYHAISGGGDAFVIQANNENHITANVIPYKFA